MKKLKLFICLFLCTFMLFNVTYVNAEESSASKEVWDEFSSKLKSNITDDGEDKSIVVNFTDSSLTVTLLAGESLNSNIDLNFEYKDGVLTFLPTTVSSEIMGGYALFNSLIIQCIAQTYAEMKGYDYEKLSDWLNNNISTLTLENDGVEFRTERFKYSDSGLLDSTSPDGGFSVDGDYDINIDIEYTSMFKLDLVNGFKTYDPSTSTPEQVVKIPNTAKFLSNINYILAVVLIASGSLLILKKLQKNN